MYYPETPEGTGVILGSMNTGYVSNMGYVSNTVYIAVSVAQGTS